ncbi:uncharacterized protein LOC122306253 [Carya illinoinensis]|uniref:uncharacterized protein LOC122306253 n=1 Tax=Carya illinoinensis TaxID=32201 RepID=UPI001C71B28C|nr:uncharacterized protein LOC122306253 [Carya illinoinensis]
MQVPPVDWEALKQLLVEHMDIFAWSHREIPGIDNEVIEHCLGIDPTHKVMPFGLKNAEVTCQKLVNRMFKEQIGRSIEVYVDDLLIKSKEPAQHLMDLQMAFEILCRYNMRLTPAKYAFGIQSGKSLGFIVFKRGIEASPDKIEVILNMKLPKSLNETQRLAGRVGTLGRFIGRSTDKCLPLFPSTVKVSPHALSTVLVKEEEAAQHPIYYVSQKVPTILPSPHSKGAQETPLAKVLRKPDSTCRLIGWSIELSEFDLEYESRKAVKGQALTNFVAEFLGFPQKETIEPLKKRWVLFIDDSSCSEGGGLGVHLLSPDSQGRYYMATLAFKVTNNETEYEALIAGLSVASQMRVTEVEARSDSQVVVNQVLGLYATKCEKLKKYLARVWKICDLFSDFTITQIPRGDNEVTNKLARVAFEVEEVSLSWQVEMKVIEIPAVGIEVGILGSNTPEWASRIVEYLEEGKLPETREEARRIKRKTTRFQLINEVLYKRGFSAPLVQCISTQEAQYILAEIHEGICRNHFGRRTLARKAVWAEYY